MSKKIYSYLVVLQLFVISIALQAQKQDDVIKKIIETGKTDNQTMHHLDVLTNRIGGRLLGSAAYETATQWAASQFKQWGMQVELQEVGTLSVGFERGPWFGRLIGENSQPLHFVTPSYTSGTKGIQSGHVVMEPRTQEEFNSMKGKLKGAWVLVNGKSHGWPIDYSAKGDKYRDSLIKVNEDIDKKNQKIQEENYYNKTNNKLLEYVKEPALFYKQMKDAGILGIIQSAPVPLVALYDRNNLEHMTFDSLPTVPDIKLDENQYAIIERMVKERRDFKLEFDIRNHFRMGPIKYHNVIGIIPGTKYPDEYVIACGHLDAFDVATGGVDDGSGVTPTMEAARLIMKAGGKPKRTMLFCLWAGEEFGLWGSKYWVEHNKEKLPKISNVINRDYGPLVPTTIAVTDAMWKDMEKITAPVNSINTDFPLKMVKRAPRPFPKTAGGSDHAYFALNGVPTMGFGIEDVKGYDFDYGEIWHTERDTYNMSIPEYQNQTSIVTAIVIYGIANLDHLLSREGYYIIQK